MVHCALQGSKDIISKLRSILVPEHLFYLSKQCRYFDILEVFRKCNILGGMKIFMCIFWRVGGWRREGSSLYKTFFGHFYISQSFVKVQNGNDFGV